MPRARLDRVPALPFTLAEINAGMVSSRYHGVGALRINFRLSEYVNHRINLPS
jgi:hypothetical protein